MKLHRSFCWRKLFWFNGLCNNSIADFLLENCISKIYNWLRGTKPRKAWQNKSESHKLLYKIFFSLVIYDFFPPFWALGSLFMHNSSISERSYEETEVRVNRALLNIEFRVPNRQSVQARLMSQSVREE